MIDITKSRKSEHRRLYYAIVNVELVSPYSIETKFVKKHLINSNRPIQLLLFSDILIAHVKHFGKLILRLKTHVGYMADPYNRQNEEIIASRLNRNSSDSLEKFKTAELGLFHPNCQKSFDSELVMIVNRETIYREVYAFTIKFWTAFWQRRTRKSAEICQHVFEEKLEADDSSIFREIRRSNTWRVQSMTSFVHCENDLRFV